VARKQTSGEPEFRLRPRRPRVPPDENKAWSRSFKNLIHLVRMTSRPTLPARSGSAPRKPHLQRCAVRVTYSPNRVSGQWAAHGRYISRRSASKESSVKEAGFTAASDRIDVPEKLGRWQSAGDQRLFKLIISPEFGERLDLKRHTRQLMARMEQDLGLRLEWVAVAHFNTEHPHVHIALRGRTDAGALRLARDYIKQGIRNHAENLCTAQLGFRTEMDALEAERREVNALQITSLDRRIAKQAFGPGGDGTFDPDALSPSNSPGQRARRLFIAARIRTLETAGLSEEIEPGRWQMDPAFLEKLKAMQIGRDRQKLIALGERANLDKTDLSRLKRPHNRTNRDPEQTKVR
jgi:type IV secretory pathway VirD2 relaxase